MLNRLSILLFLFRKQKICIKLRNGRECNLGGNLNILYAQYIEYAKIKKLIFLKLFCNLTCHISKRKER